jgi:hypothetical protein
MQRHGQRAAVSRPGGKGMGSPPGDDECVQGHHEHVGTPAGGVVDVTHGRSRGADHDHDHRRHHRPAHDDRPNPRRPKGMEERHRQRTGDEHLLSRRRFRRTLDDEGRHERGQQHRVSRAYVDVEHQRARAICGRIERERSPEEDSAFLADEGLIARVVPLQHDFQSAESALQDDVCNGRAAESQPRHLGARGTTSADCAGRVTREIT